MPATSRQVANHDFPDLMNIQSVEESHPLQLEALLALGRLDSILSAADGRHRCDLTSRSRRLNPFSTF
jgi:hypothetical protein